MYKNYQVVVNTAAGRRRYMQYLIPYIVESKIVDRYDIWINTHNGADIEFFKQMAEAFPVINLVWQPDGIVNGIASINAFYKQCIEPNTIYFKLDDDIVWMEPRLIEKMVQFRVDNPQYFLVSPLVINNALSTYLLEINKKIKLDRYYNSSANHPILWNSGIFATSLHLWFIQNHLANERWSTLYVGKKEMAMTRFSINAILWFGDEMRKFNGVVPGDDEEFLSCIYPTLNGISNAWNGDAIVSHFAFFTQRQHLDKAGILEMYGAQMQQEWTNNDAKKQIFQQVHSIMQTIQQNEAKYLANPSPYKTIIVSRNIKQILKSLLPTWLTRWIHDFRGSKPRQYILTSEDQE